MKIKYLFAILMVLLLVGCAQEAQEEEQEEVAAEVQDEMPLEEEIDSMEEVAEPAAPSEADVMLSRTGFDPAELSVTVPAKVMVKITGATRHTITKVGGGFRSAGLTDGQSAEIMIEEAGSHEYFDIISKKKLKIEASAAATEESMSTE